MLRLQGIAKTYPGGTTAVAGVDLEVAAGELVVLLGPSGCGKSTLLRIVAGIEAPTQGRVFLDGRDVTELPPQRRDIAMVFQNYALYPHMSVRDNLGFGLKMRGLGRSTIAQRVGQVAETLGIMALLDRRPAQLSGGQRQRVALGRAIARNAKAFLLDEPLSNLDVQLRVVTRTEIARLHRELGVPMLYVTHDQEEAMTLGDRVAVMRAGRILQLGTPREIYARPVTQFVGRFVGSPRMNLLDAHITLEPEGAARLELLGKSFFLPALPQGAAAALAATSGASVRSKILVGVRPEDVSIVEMVAADAKARIDVVETLGRETLLHVLLVGPVETNREVLRVLAAGSLVPAPGSLVGLGFRPESFHVFAPEPEDQHAESVFLP